jgi:dienelactone hydrolase
VPSLTLDTKRLVRLGAAALLSLPVVFLACTALLARVYTQAVLHPGCQGDRASLAEYSYEAEAVTFPSRNGPTLRGWLTRGNAHPEIVIIVLPGHAGNTRYALGDALMLAEAGYSTLIYEHRSCADPALAASTGVREADDLLGAADFLRARGDVAHIGALGFSEGGTAILLAAAQEPALEAVAAMGGYASLRDDILGPVDQHGWYDRLMRRVVLWMLELEGVPLDAASPVEVIGQISPRPLLLIYGEYEAANGQALYAAAGEPKDLWIVPGAGHGGYAAVAPDEYGERIARFFDATFDAAFQTAGPAP